MQNICQKYLDYLSILIDFYLSDTFKFEMKVGHSAKSEKKLLAIDGYKSD